MAMPESSLRELHRDHLPPAARGPGLVAAEPSIEAAFPESVPRCVLRLSAGGRQINSVLTGFAMLARAGRIRLEFDLRPIEPPLPSLPWHIRDKACVHIELEVEGGGSAAIDPHDSWEIDEQLLARHPLYFKRSLLPNLMLLRGGERLRPLGLVHDVRTDFANTLELRRELSGAGSIAQRGRMLVRWLLAAAGADRLGMIQRTRWSQMHAAPARGQDPRVLLMAGLWDPALVPEDAPAKREEWRRLNGQRVECIRALRREFGDRFHGGVKASEFARREYPDVVLDDPLATSRPEFLRQVRTHPICVTSTGLHGSNGGRLAEFVSFSRAIVTEPLQYAVQGDFAAGSHFLEYRDPDSCVAQVGRLFADSDARESMMRRNHDYYRQWLHPERLAMRLIALTCAAARTSQSRAVIASKR
jgi:hypothetical protein